MVPEACSSFSHAHHVTSCHHVIHHHHDEQAGEALKAFSAKCRQGRGAVAYGGGLRPGTLLSSNDCGRGGTAATAGGGDGRLATRGARSGVHLGRCNGGVGG